MINNSFRSVNALSLLLVGIIFSLSLAVLINPGFAQTTSDDDKDVLITEENILSEDLANNPVAQDILKKIEQTKRWIAELEQRNYEQLEKQKELDEKRIQALASLEQDLKEWELLWDYYSPRNSFERFVDKVPDLQVKEVFWDQFEFKEQKVKAGRDALKQVKANGGSLEQGMGEILGTSPSLPSQKQQTVTPLTTCDDEFRVVYNVETKIFLCARIYCR